MKPILFVLLFFAFQNISGQFAVIRDPDGFVNVRETPGKNGKIKAKISNDQIVYCYLVEEAKDNWYKVDYGEWLNDSIWRYQLSGYIHRSRFKYISEFENIISKERNNDKVIFQIDSFKITLTKVPFLVKNNKLGYGKGDQSSFIKKINGKEAWGIDGYSGDIDPLLRSY